MQSETTIYQFIESDRGDLAKPMTPVIQTPEIPDATNGSKMVIAVGDVVSLALKQLGITPKFFICDYQTKRQPNPHFEKELGSWGAYEIRVPNTPGTISNEAHEAVCLAVFESKPAPIRIFVEGEEDLLVLSCIIFAPVGAKIIYGVPDRGVAVLEVTPQLRRWTHEFLTSCEVKAS